MNTKQEQVFGNDYVRNLVRCKARELVGRGDITAGDVEDIEQTLWSVLLEAADAFDPEKGTLETFASRVVERRAANILRNRATEQRCMQEYRTRKAAEVALAGNSQVPGTYDPRRQIDLALDMETVLASLPDDLRDICERLKTDSVSKVARNLGVPRSTLRESIVKIRDIFAQAGFQEYLQ